MRIAQASVEARRGRAAEDVRLSLCVFSLEFPSLSLASFYSLCTRVCVCLFEGKPRGSDQERRV